MVTQFSVCCIFLLSLLLLLLLLLWTTLSIEVRHSVKSSYITKYTLNIRRIYLVCVNPNGEQIDIENRGVISVNTFRLSLSFYDVNFPRKDCQDMVFWATNIK